LDEHVFRSAKPDAAGAEGDGVFHLLWCIRVSANTHARDFGAPIQQLIEVAISLGFLRNFVAMEQTLDNFRGSVEQLVGVNSAARSVDREIIFAFAEDRAVH